MLQYVWLVIAFPLLGALANGLFGRYLSRKASGVIGCGAVALAFLVGLISFIEYTQRAADASKYIDLVLWPWIHVTNFKVDAALLIDPLSLTLLLLITGVGFLIHYYSTGYMEHDEGFSRFFTYLNLFVAMMLILVLANNLVMLFVGWEGVGLCSYLLIGFWYKNMENANCGMKAFVVNRIGDFGVLLAIFMIYGYFHTLQFTEIFQKANEVLGQVDAWVPLTISLLLMLGACGKSAQLPLHIWLPDAMAGPTPVSALIHAATMVTAGVYMVCRLNPIFTASPEAGMIVALIGGVTAFMAATIALTQNDIKKVLAYSTVSQLGFMFLACGVGAYWVAIFHVLTHAFFKACLFLGSGSVIHGMHEEQDTRVMGGLAKFMPLTYLTFALSTLAIAGIFPFSGFFSKDEILWRVATWQASAPGLAPLLYLLALFTAFMTAFYMGRVTFKTFLGAPRWTDDFVKHQHQPHESPRSMTTPLLVLASLAVVGGFLLFTPKWLGNNTVLEDFLSPSTGGEAQLAFMAANSAPEHAAATPVSAAELKPFLLIGNETGTEVFFALVSVGIALWALLGLAKPLYTKRFGESALIAKRFGRLYDFSLNKWYIDEFYNKVIVVPGTALAQSCWRFFDVKIVDGLVNGVAWLVGVVGMLIRPLQSGYVRNYALYLLLGAVVYLFVSLVRR